MKQARKFFLLAGVIIVVDQLSKILVKLNMQLGDEIQVLGNFFKIYFIENKGAAFGLTIPKILSGVGVEMDDVTGKLILSLFSIAAVCAIGYILYRISTHKSPLPYFVAMIFGGALGNIIDRTFYGTFFSSINQYEGGIFHGRVVDMFYFDIWKGQIPEWVPIWGGDYTALWPIFNVADSSISIGIVVILIFQGRFFKMDETARAVAAPAADVPPVPPAPEVSAPGGEETEGSL
ncbi:MAG: lipoprotein signal peptidase [Bacteroidetes bacterium]|nr:MAG: lipoprotein signal peptidase [Bacteroidota bacterium]